MSLAAWPPGADPLSTALQLSVVAALCSALGGALAVLLEGRAVPLQRLALWQAALGAALLCLGVCDILPEAASGLSAPRALTCFAIGAGGSALAARALRHSHLERGLGSRVLRCGHRSCPSRQCIWAARDDAVRARREGGVIRGRGERREEHEIEGIVGNVRRGAVLDDGRMGRQGSVGMRDRARGRPVQRSMGVLGSHVRIAGDVRRGSGHVADRYEEVDWRRRLAEEGEVRRLEVLAVGMATFFSLSAHNLLEGMSILLAAHEGLEKGVRLGTAVSLENVPEGMAIALPILYATRCRTRAVRYALISGLVEPLGVLLLGVVLRPWMSQVLVSSLLATVAGILVSLSLMEILPLAIKTSSLRRAGEFNLWIAIGLGTATIVQPLLLYYARFGVIQ